MQRFRIATQFERQAGEVLARLRESFEREGARISPGMDGRSFWVFGATDELFPEATVDARPGRIDITLVRDNPARVTALNDCARQADAGVQRVATFWEADEA